MKLSSFIVLPFCLYFRQPFLILLLADVLLLILGDMVMNDILVNSL